MPVADAQRSTSVPSIAKLSCLHVDHYNPGTKVPPPLDRPPGTNTGLSGGAIAGIVVGSVVGALLIAGFAFWIFWRQRRANKRKSGDQVALNELAGEHERKELDGGDQERQEMEGEHAKEMSGDATQKHELSNPETEVHEMPADLNLPEMGAGVRKDDKKEDEDEEDNNEYHAS